MSEKMEMISERQAAKILQISHQTLGNYRRDGKGPKCTVIKGTVKNIILYRMEDLLSWMEKRLSL